MISSTMPLAEHPGGHPIHRATALLRRALLSSTVPSPDPAEIWDDRRFRLAPAPTGLSQTPVNITFPASLATILALQSNNDDACQAPVICADDAAPLDAPFTHGWAGDDMLDRAAQRQLEVLVQAFYRRQRQASLLVAYSIAAAFLLTLVGVFLVLSATGPDAAGRDTASPSAAPQVDIAPSLRQQIDMRTGRPAEGKPLLIPAAAETEIQGLELSAMGADVIRVATGRPLALAPLLPVGPARYVLLQGLPEDAELSAGRRTGPGTWMVKDENVPGLTLTLGKAASGDYPLDVYQLDSGSGPQARHRLVLRVDQVEPAPKIYSAGLSLGWPMAPSQETEEPAPTPDIAETGVGRDQAQRLLREGDIAAARRLLTQAAEGGDAASAYELALTYDGEVLAKAGINGIDGDPAIARTWYAYAARAGHAEAGRRLQMLSRPRAAS